TITQRTFTRPDGSIQSRTVIVTNSTTIPDPETGLVKTIIHTKTQHPDGSIEESVRETEPHSCLEPASEKQKLLDSQKSYRSKLRERWAQRRQERQMQERQERLEENLDKVQARVMNDYAQLRQARRERLRELREAEAKQREATAAAYGFNNIDHGDKSVDNSIKEDLSQPRSQVRRVRHGWRAHEWNAAATKEVQGEKVGEETADNVGELSDEALSASRSTSRRAWPPRGYLRRQELEAHNGPPHNV
ncbi:hypothetical protein BGX28_008696, partial [Mortierella sp. GBA30]